MVIDGELPANFLWAAVGRVGLQRGGNPQHRVSAAIGIAEIIELKVRLFYWGCN